MAQTFSLTALKLNGGSDNYVFTRGDRVVPVGGVEDGSWYRFTVRDPSGAILNPAFACTASSDFATNDHGYVIQPSDPLSTGGTYTFTLEQFSDDTCSGTPVHSATQYFSVVSAVAYTSPLLDQTTNRFAVGQTAFVRVEGMPSSTFNWNVTWITPTGTLSCANSAGADRPSVGADGGLPDNATVNSPFLAYPPITGTSDPYNNSANYDVANTCQAFALTNQGQWRLRLQSNPSNFVVLPVFVLSNDCTAPVLFFDPENRTVCAGTPVSFSAFATGTNITYRWRKNGVNLSNGGGISGATTDTLSIAAPGTNDAASYDVLIVGDCGSVTSQVATLTVNLYSACSISGPTSVCANSVGNVFSAPPQMAGYTWAVFGGATINGAADGSNVAINVTSPGIVTLSLTLSNSAGCVTNCSRQIFVTQPTATVSGNSTICAGSNATIQAVLNGSSPWTVTWSDGFVQSNLVSSSLSRIVAPGATTTFTITNIRDALCFGTASGSATVFVNTAPTVTTNPVSRSVCIGSSVSFTAAASGTAPIQVQWQVSTNDGANFSNISGATNTTFTFTPSMAESGRVYRATFQNACGSAISSNAVLTVYPLPACSIAGSSPVCANSAGHIYTGVDGAAAYGWSISGNGSISGSTNGQSVTVNAGAVGTFTLSLRTVSSNGCSTVCTRIITNRTATAVVTGTTAICPGGSAVLQVALTGVAPWTITWQDGLVQSGITSNVVTRVVSPITSTTYSLTSVTDATCVGSVSGSAAITLQSAPVVNLSPIDTVACSGRSVTLLSRAGGLPGPVVQWQMSSDGGGTFVNVSGATSTNYSFLATTNHHGNFYRAIFSNVCGLATSAVAVLTVNLSPTPVISSDAKVCASSSGNTAFVSNIPSGSTILWTISGGTLTSPNSGTNVTYNAAASGSVQLRVNVTSPNGCTGGATNSVPIVTSGTMVPELWANGTSPGVWTSGNMNDADQNYSEGSVIPMRMTVRNLCSGAAWCVTITYDFQQGATHFMDSLSTYNANVTTVNGFECQGTVCGTPTTFPIPTDASLPVGAQIPGFFTVYNGSITNVSAYTTGAGGTRSITLYGVAASGGGAKDVVILAGAHLARENEWGFDNGASAVSGGSRGVVFNSSCNGGSDEIKLNPGDLIQLADVAVIKSSSPNPACVSNSLIYTLTVTNLGPQQATGVNVTDVLPAGVTFFSATTSQGTFSGTTNLAFTLGSINAGSNAIIQITVLVSNSAPGTLTNIARVTSASPADPNTNNNVSTNLTLVNRAIAFALHPLGLMLCPGENAGFSVIATGSPPISYQWYRNGSPIDGATSSNLFISGVSSNQAGNYFAVASGPCNTATSLLAVLMVKTNISATPLQPVDVCEGANVSFTTTISGPGPHSIVWRRNGTVLPGETNTSLVLSNVTSGAAGVYTVEISGLCNSVTNSAALTVYGLTTATPLADRNVCPSNNVTFTTIPGGTGPFTFEWYHDAVLLTNETGSSLVLTNVSTANEGTYTVIVRGHCNSVTNSGALLVQGDGTASALADVTTCPGGTAVFSTTVSGTGPFAFTWRKDNVVISSNIFTTATNSTLVISNVSAADAGTYSVEVAGACNGGSSAVLTVKTNTAATPLTDLTLCPGQNASFSTLVSGTGPFSFVWRRDGMEISGETNASLLITNVTIAFAGVYTVEVTGDCNSVTNTATLVVGIPPTLTPLTSVTACPNATVTFTTSATGLEPFAFVWRRNGVEIVGETNASLTLTNITALDAATYSVEVADQCGAATNSAQLVVREATTASPLVSITVCEGQPAVFTTVPGGEGPFTFAWYKDAVLINGETNNSLVLSGAGTNDVGTYTVEVQGACNSVTNSATLNVNELTTATPLANIAACEGSPAAFSSAVSGTGPFTFVWRKDNVVLAEETNSTLSILAVSTNSAGTYTLEVYGACNSVTNSATLVLNALTTASPLSAQTVCAGSTAVFSTIANGSGPFTYAWLKDGVLLDGETNSSLLITNVATNAVGIYSVEVGGLCNTVTNSAQLSVSELVSTTPLVDVAVCAGQSAVFSTISSGTGPFSYVWRKGEQLLVDETNASLVIDPVAAGNAGTYSVEVHGSCNTVTNSATLIVLAPTTATPLNGMSRCIGENAIFATVPDGAGPFTFVWRKNGGLLNGQTNNTLSLLISSTDDAGTYSVEVTGTCNSVTNTAELTINEVTSAAPMSNEVRCAGSSVMFTATPSGTGPFTYAWRKASTYLPGATNSTLELVNLLATDAGVYTVEITGACNTASASATLNVSTQPNASALTNQTRCVGDNVTFSTTVSGIGPFTYIWRKGTNALQGQFTGSLTLTNLRTADAGTYSVEITGGCGTLTNSVTLTISSRTSATPLVGQNRCVGSSATFVTLASGAGPFTYVWRKDGVVLAGRTNSSATFANLTLADTGVYTVEIYGQCNSVTNNATLTVNTIPVVTGLTNQIVCPGSTATLHAQVSGTGSYTYVWRRNGFVLAGQTTNTLVLTSMNASKTGTYTLEVNNICRNVTNSVTVSLKTNVTVAPIASQSQCEGGTVTFVANAFGTGPFTYQWQKDGNDVLGATQNTFTIISVTLSNIGTYSVRVSGECSSTNASTTLNVSPLTTATPLQDVTVCEGQPAQLSTVVGGGGAPYQFVWRRNGVLLANQTNGTLTFTTTAPSNSGLYTVEITGCGKITNSALVTVKELLRATMETNRIACSCADLVLGPVVTGTGPFTYLWRKDGVMLEGETNVALNLGKLVKASPGVFTIEITGPCNSVTNSTTLQLFQEVSGQYFAHSPITIPNLGAGSPYPSRIFVQCAPASVSELTVNLVGLSHTFPDDIDIMLVAPDGRGVRLMSDAGGTSAFLLNGVDLTFSDAATTSLPNNAQIVSGTYRPSDYASAEEPGGDAFPSPAPVPNATTLGELISANPNGYWSLYITDDVGFGSGSGTLAGGWNLSFSRRDYVFANVFLSEPQLLPNGSFQMQLNGEPNKFYYLEASADLQQWNVIQTNFLQGITMPLTDTTAPQFNYRFYRISGCRE